MEYELPHPPFFRYWENLFQKKTPKPFFVLGFPRKLLLCWSPWPLNLPPPRDVPRSGTLSPFGTSFDSPLRELQKMGESGNADGKGWKRINLTKP